MSPRQRKLLPWIALCVIYVVWGSTYLAIRIVVREVPPMAAASLRFLAHVVCRRIEDVNALLADLQKTRALQSSRTAFVLETVLEKGTLGALPPGLFVEDPAEAPARSKG